MRSETLTKLVTGCFVVSLITLIVLLSVSFSSVGINESGLNYSSVSKRIEPVAQSSGIYFLGIGHSFLKYPTTLQQLEFSKDTSANGPPVRSRTSDGLEVQVEISFQFRLDSSKLYSLFMTYEHQYLHVYENFAIDLISEVTTHYTANQFFTQRRQIGQDMQQQLDKLFTEELFASVVFLQLRSVDLPDKYESSIQQTEVMKQDIFKALAEKNTATVVMSTELQAANYTQNVTLNLAAGTASNIYTNAHVQAQSYQLVQSQYVSSYSALMQSTSMNTNTLLAYLKAKAIWAYNGTDIVLSLSKIDP